MAQEPDRAKGSGKHGSASPLPLNDDFDPYHSWLAIPKDKRPPTHYQLFALSPDEKDQEVIETAVLQRTSYVRNEQSGPCAGHAKKILDELAEAALVLRDPLKRRRYDATLHQLHRAQRRIASRSGVVINDSIPGRILNVVLSPFRFLGWLFEIERNAPATRTGPSIFAQPLILVSILLVGLALMLASLWLPWGKITGEKVREWIPLPTGAEQATCIVELDPPNASLKVEGDGVTLSGTGGRREIKIARPHSTRPITLFVSANGYQDLQRVLRPSPGDNENLSLRLEPVKSGASPESFTGYQEAPAAKGTVPDFFKTAEPSATPTSAPSRPVESSSTAKGEVPDFFKTDGTSSPKPNGEMPGFFQSDESPSAAKKDTPDFFKSGEPSPPQKKDVPDFFASETPSPEQKKSTPDFFKKDERHPLEVALAGTKWLNSANVSFEWTKDGQFLHNGKQRQWRVLDGHRGQIVFEPNHVDTLVFNHDFTEFKQLVYGGPKTFQGRRR